MLRVSTAATVLLGAVASQQSEVTTTDSRLARVGAVTPEKFCIFENEDDSWCFSTTPPMAKIGWEWKQTFSQTPTGDEPIIKYYQLKLVPFGQLQAFLVSKFTILNLYVNQLEADLTKFKTDVFFSLIFNSWFEVCPGMGWNIEKIFFKWIMSQSMWNCRKTIANDFIDYTTTWVGYDAKWFQDCNQSAAVDIKLWEKELYEARSEMMWYGTVYPKSVSFCYSFPGINRPTTVGAPDDGVTQMAKQFYSGVGSYIQENYLNSLSEEPTYAVDMGEETHEIPMQ